MENTQNSEENQPNYDLKELKEMSFEKFIDTIATLSQDDLIQLLEDNTALKRSKAKLEKEKIIAINKTFIADVITDDDIKSAARPNDYVNSLALKREVQRSYKNGEITPKLAEYIMIMVKKIQMPYKYPAFGEGMREDVAGETILHMIEKCWWKCRFFAPTNSVFGWYTQCIHNKLKSTFTALTRIKTVSIDSVFDSDED